MSDQEEPAIPEVLEDSGPETNVPKEFGAHLGGVSSVMLHAWHDTEHRFVALALRVVERTGEGRLVLEPPDPEWLVLLERRYDVVCLTAQVDERFVTVEGTLHAVIRQPQPRVIIVPVSQTFWDTISRRVARVACDAPRTRPTMAVDAQYPLFGRESS